MTVVFCAQLVLWLTVVIRQTSSKSRKNDGFIWGAATASYQIEGAVNRDGRLPSIWDTFCNEGGHVYKNESGAIADDDYDKYKTDIQLLANLGVSHYRFSIAWPRILPDGLYLSLFVLSLFLLLFFLCLCYFCYCLFFFCLFFCAQSQFFFVAPKATQIKINENK